MPSRVPPNFFGFAFGLGGLGETWAIAAHEGLAPAEVSTALAALSGLVWLVVTAGYLRFALTSPATLRRDLADPVAGPFLSLAVIAPMLWAVVGIAPHDLAIGRAVFDVFLALTFLLGGWFTGQWIYGDLDVDRLHPGYFLPTVAGGLVASDGASLLGQRGLAQAAFGLGIVSWLVLGSMILGRLFLRPQLPPPLLPTIAIEVAPAAVASLAWLDAHGDRIDAVAGALAGYGLMMVVAQLRLLPIFARLPFMPSTWAFTFSWAAVAGAALHWLADRHPAGHRAEAYAVLVAVTALIAAIAARTLVAVGRRQLLPAPAPPAAPAAPAAAAAAAAAVLQPAVEPA